ncbi:THO complex subunit 1 [Toxocara canis]|uniref:THO complex subunit 1 n=1 Tax=Toxocara canis TaxID=6265 RepID=A0A0B2V4H5_TOXCA|nr:THO complex subunit 1 [Toxocara canis]
MLATVQSRATLFVHWKALNPRSCINQEQLVMDEAVSNMDMDQIRASCKAMRESGKSVDFIKTCVEEALHKKALAVASTSEPALLDVNVRQMLALVFQIAREDLCAKASTVSVMQDVFDTVSIEACERLFVVVEDNLSVWKTVQFYDPCKNTILRMCNDILKRLSRTVDTSFCGRILVLLARALPLCEKSGLNLVSHFNTDNTTKYDLTELSAEGESNEDGEEMETGEIKESKDIPVDFALYAKFWQLQTFFSSPTSCYDRSKWRTFQQNTDDVLNVLLSHKLGGSVDAGGQQKRKRKRDEEVASFSVDRDSSFATASLNSTVEGSVDEKDNFFAKYVTSQKKMLQREKEWSEWKNKGCADYTLLADKEKMAVVAKRPRNAYKPTEVDLGSTVLTNLWKINPDMLSACQDQKRKFAPSIVDFLRDPLLELDPEQMVEDRYKSIPSKRYEVISTMGPFLGELIKQTALNIPELRNEIPAATNSEAKVESVNDTTSTSFQNGNSECAESSPLVSEEQMHELAPLLAHDLKSLVDALFAGEAISPSPVRESSKAVISILARWKRREGDAATVKKLSSLLLEADLFSEQVGLVFKTVCFQCNSECAESSPLVSEEQMHELAPLLAHDLKSLVDALFAGEAISPSPVRESSKAVISILARWKRREGDAATVKKLSSLLLEADLFSEQVGLVFKTVCFQW